MAVEQILGITFVVVVGLIALFLWVWMAMVQGTLQDLIQIAFIVALVGIIAFFIWLIWMPDSPNNRPPS